MMERVNVRQWLYFKLFQLRGLDVGKHYDHYLNQYEQDITAQVSRDQLIRLLSHCQQHVPYYAKIMNSLGGSYEQDPISYLEDFPILTKAKIRKHFEELKSDDLAKRHWYLNHSSGSTGEPIQLIQDWEYISQSGAISQMFSRLVGRQVGECEIRLWGSVEDIINNNHGWRSRIINHLSNTIFLNTFRMTPDIIREFIHFINLKSPKLIIAYVEAIDEIARYAELHDLEVLPQQAIITSAGTLQPFNRATIERVFQCKVYNRYGSREVGDIACELPGKQGLWVAPWGNYIEVIDPDGRRVPTGGQGEILVTLLTNYAMPLVRYRIGDLGILNQEEDDSCQSLAAVLGRITDSFTNAQGTIAYGGYFGSLVYDKPWILQYQVIQKKPSWIIYRFVESGVEYDQDELITIQNQTRLVMGKDCQVDFEMVEDIAPLDSGKFRHVISEVSQ